MKTIDLNHARAIAERITEAKEDGVTQFTIEPGRGATYANDKATLYGHGQYGRESVLEGRSKRVWIEDADEDEGGATLLQAACKLAGVDVDVCMGSSFTPDPMYDLPGEDEPQPD